MALAVDASSPPLVTANATTVTTASFTPPVGSLLVAFALGTSFSGNPNAVVTSTGLTFTSQLLNNGAGEGTVQVFTSPVGGSGGSARTVNLSVSGYASCALKVWVVTGQHATLYVDNTASGTSTANVINAGITTNNDGCWVLGGGSEFIGLGVPTTTDSGIGVDDATGGMSYLAPARAGETVKAGPELVNFDANGTSAASWYWILISIRPAAYTAPAVGKVADQGQISNITSQSSTAVDLPAAGSITTGNYLIARVAMDNSGTSGVARTLSVTDTRSNSWTVTTGANRTAGAANDGSTCYIAYAKVVNAYTNGDDLTFTYSGAVVAKAINVEEWYGIDGTTPLAVAATTATGSSATPSVARTPLASGQLFYGAIASEGPATDTFTEDTDTTDGSWVTLTRVASASATAASNQDVYGVAKLVTGTTAQTWNPSIGTSRDWAQVALVFAPAAGGGSVSADAAMSGTGTLAGTASTVKPVDASLAATATGTATVTGSKSANAALSGTGTLSASATPSRNADAGLSAVGALTASAVSTKPVAAAATATGTLAASAIGSKPVDAALAATGTLTAGAVSSKSTDAALAGTGALTASATVTSSGGVDGTLAGIATLVATASGSKPVTATLNGVGTFAATTTADKGVSAALAGTGTLSGAATSTKPAAANLTATGTLAASATVTTSGVSADATLTGSGTLSAAALLTRPAAAALSGTASATAQMVVSRSMAGALAGVGSLTASFDSAGQVTVRPNVGTTARPGSGRTIRPYTGTTNRP